MKRALKLGALSILNICVVFLSQWYLLTQLGPGVASDALFASMTLPQLILAVISGSLMHALVPILSGKEKKRLHHDAWSFLFLIGSSFGLIASLLYLSASWWVPLTVPGFSEAGKVLTVELTRIQLIGMVFAGINGIQLATYHAGQRFLWAEFTTILSSLTGFAILIWALPRYGVVAAAWISILRMLVQTILLAPGMGRPVWPDLGNPAIKVAWQRAKPLLLGTSYYKTDSLVDRFLLSMASSGSLSLFYLAQQIYSALNQVINSAIVAPLVVLLSTLHKSGDKRSFRSAYRIKVWQIGTICIVILLVLVLLGQSILNILLDYGKINPDNVKELWWIMIYLAGVFMGGALGQVFSSAFYAIGDTATPTRMSLITYTIYIPGKISAFYYFGVTGLALSTSVYYVVNCSVLAYFFGKYKFDDNIFASHS
jgi:putative peptidoglycan lipid II flippase